MKSVPVTSKGNKTLVKLYKATWVEWVVARDYDDTKPEGQKWSSGTYFENIADAAAYLEEE